MVLKTSLPLLALASLAVSETCPIQFDGRIPADATLDLFDTSNSPYNPDFVFGKGLAWSKILKLPDVPTSLLDAANGTKAVEVTINDDSIFAPSADNVQTGFRRAELQPMSNSGSDPSTQGVKTLHFSLRKDTERPLNFTHEYQLVFLETADYSTNQFALKTGTILGHTAQENPDSLILQSNVANPTDLFTVAFDPDVWHNFGLYMDFTNNKMQAYYSTDNEPLASVTELVSNDLSGQGQYHFGILKKPTGDNLGDITKEGYQESGINEGIVFGGIFEENSEGDCITLGGKKTTCKA